MGLHETSPKTKPAIPKRGPLLSPWAPNTEEAGTVYNVPLKGGVQKVPDKVRGSKIGPGSAQTKVPCPHAPGPGYSLDPGIPGLEENQGPGYVGVPCIPGSRVQAGRGYGRVACRPGSSKAPKRHIKEWHIKEYSSDLGSSKKKLPKPIGNQS